ncbi:MAG TPA: DUF1360 domain-containing protein [Nocardioidaceae bacterium]|nr:DUF1360 domain-containing protein [Nocardioidaceae bacterium]
MAVQRASDRSVRPGISLLTDALAVYRLTVLVKDDKITARGRDAVWRRYGAPDAEESGLVSYLLTCPWCLSMYFGAAAVIGRRAMPRAWDPVARVLAFSATTGLLAEGKEKLAA